MIFDITFSREQHLGLITLKRPKALNALTLPMIRALQEHLLEWQEDKTIHAVVIQAEGEKAFCAGGDVRWLYESGRANNPEQKQFFWHEYRLNYFIHQFKKPYIALMDGMTMGGGVGISLHGSHPVATERFIFAMPETSIGFFPDIGASYLLAACPGKTGIYLGLTGNRLNAAEALSLGLIKKLVNSKQIPQLLDNLIQCDLSVDAHHRVDACLEEFKTPEIQNAIINERAAIDSCFAESSMEQIINLLKTRADLWSEAVLSNLQQKAPLSLKITLAQLEKAKSLSMGECMEMDYCLVNHFIQDQDFYEGVRALIIDKDKTPIWNPSSLDLVTEAKVADYFEKTEEQLNLDFENRL